MRKARKGIPDMLTGSLGETDEDLLGDEEETSMPLFDHPCRPFRQWFEAGAALVPFSMRMRKGIPDMLTPLLGETDEDLLILGDLLEEPTGRGAPLRVEMTRAFVMMPAELRESQTRAREPREIRSR